MSTVIQVPVHDRRITRLAFLERFSDNSAIALDLASIGDTATAATIRRYINKVNAATYIDLSLPETESSVLGLASLGLISTDEAHSIIHMPISDKERYKGDASS